MHLLNAMEAAVNRLMHVLHDLKLLPFAQEQAKSLSGLNLPSFSPALTAFAGLLLLLLIFLLYSGMCHRVRVETDYGLRPKMTIAYTFGFGGYREAAKALDEWRLLYPFLPRITILYNSPIYPFDNDTTELKKSPTYAIGFVVNQGTYEIAEKEYCKLKELGFNFATLPEDSFSVATKFVHRNYLSLFFASQKIFVPLSKYVQEKHLCAHPLIQVDQNATLDFFAPLGKQFDFYVREASTYYGISLVHKSSRIQIVRDGIFDGNVANNGRKI